MQSDTQSPLRTIGTHGRRLSPAAFVGGGLQHLGMAGMVFQQPQTKVQGVLSGSESHFIDKTFFEKRLV